MADARLVGRMDDPRNGVAKNYSHDDYPSRSHHTVGDLLAFVGVDDWHDANLNRAPRRQVAGFSGCFGRPGVLAEELIGRVEPEEQVGSRLEYIRFRPAPTIAARLEMLTRQGSAE